MIGLATLTVTAVAVATAIYTEARCICNRIVMSVPGAPTLEIRPLAKLGVRSGRGRVLRCQRCRTYLEVIEHG